MAGWHWAGTHGRCLRARRRCASRCIRGASDLAAEAGVPPYVIFHDATLREMAASRPASLAALGEVSGVGTRKLEAYGEAFLRVIREN
jgi:superfamily II DNA helicase RecQ